jgi:hypothetical protein
LRPSRGTFRSTLRFLARELTLLSQRRIPHVTVLGLRSTHDGDNLQDKRDRKGIE